MTFNRMKAWHPLLLCALVFAVGVQDVVARGSSEAGSVRLWLGAVVIEDVIRLGDVAQLHGFDADTKKALKELVITSAPEPGGSRILPLSAVREALAKHGVNRAKVIVKGAAECAVRRPVETSPPAPKVARQSKSTPNPQRDQTDGRTLRDAITAYFDRQLAAYGGRADINFGRTSAGQLDLSEPEFRFRLQPRSDSIIGLIQLEATILRDAVEVQKAPIVVTVAMLRDVAVSRRAINRGATVGAGDVHMVTRRFTQLNRIGFADPGEVIGMRARRFIPPGELVGTRDLERVPLVKRGQIVEVISRFGTISVTTAAKVIEDGEYGQLVTLHMQGRRGARIVGRVVGPRCVQVSDEVPPALRETALVLCRD
ncbi:MAG: flagellar basal body P-ring formation protein FlgA [Phycisphaerae bacterium]|nr:flagellar basal body P-ring formation protein FlgA [Phycisphaerae bacterium]